MTEISKNLRKLNILYVEDDESVNMIFTNIFKKFVNELYSALNGEEGLEIFKKHHIDIVISDIQMPKMSGIEMAKKIREINEEVPIIFTTAYGDSTYLKEAIEIGVDAYILKPIDKNKIIKKLNKIADNLVLKKELDNYIKLMKIVFDYQTNVLVLFDKECNVVFYNKAVKEMSERLGQSQEDIFEFIKHKIREVLKAEDIEDEEKIISTSYKDRFCDIKIKKVNDYILVNCIDVTHLKEEINEIEDKSLRDELTGAYNRKKIDKIMNSLNNTEICLIMFDIDNFKKINDTYGHLKGDEVLQKMSQAIKENLRVDDLFVRWGGEEFIILLKNSTLENAKKIAEKLRNVINSMEIEEVGHFSCSFGVACGVVTLENDFDKLLKQSDDALYLAKNNGKNRVEVHW